MTKLCVTIHAGFDTSSDAEAALEAVESFRDRHNLTNEDVIAIHQNHRHRLFNELDSDMYIAAADCWEDPNGLPEIVLYLR